MLTVSTTHLKVGWLQRNGVAHSDQATMTEHFIRHGDVLTVVHIVDDPIYLEEPFIRSTNWVLNPAQEIGRTSSTSLTKSRAAERVRAALSAGIPGALLEADRVCDRAHRLPADARGGAATTYPEYQRTMNGSRRRHVARSHGCRRMTARSAPHGRAETETTIHVVHVQGKVHMLVGAGGNITVQIGDEGVLLVDTGLAARSDELLAAIRQVTDKPIRIVINTHVARRSRRRQRARSPRAGEWLGGNAPGNSGLPLDAARVLAHEQVMARMSAPSGQTPPRPFGAWPTETFFSEDKELFFNDEAIQLIHQPGSHRRRRAGVLPPIRCRRDGDLF